LAVPDEGWPSNMKMRNQDGALWIVQPGLRLDETIAVAASATAAAAAPPGFPSSPDADTSSSSSSSATPSTGSKSKKAKTNPDASSSSTVADMLSSASFSASSSSLAHISGSHPPSRMVFRFDFKPGLTSNLGASKLFRLGLVLCTPDQRTVLAWAFSPAFLVASSTLPPADTFLPELDRLNFGVFASTGFTSADFAVPPTQRDLLAHHAQLTGVAIESVPTSSSSSSSSALAAGAAGAAAAADDDEASSSSLIKSEDASSSSPAADTSDIAMAVDAVAAASSTTPAAKRRGRKVRFF
jgi:hypothetical protein